MRAQIVLMALLVGLQGSANAAAPTPAPVAPFRLCVIDQGALISQSRLAANEAARFQQVRQAAQAKFDSDSRTLESDARALESFRTAVPPATFKVKSDEIARRRAELQQRGDQINRSLSQLDSKLTNAVSQAAGPVMRTVSIAQGCSALISASTLVGVYDATIDITAAVAQQMNGQPAPGGR